MVKGSITFVSLNARLKDLSGPVSRIIKKKRKSYRGTSLIRTPPP